MKKIIAILFLIKCVCYISLRIIKGKTWNSIDVSLEEDDGRIFYNYRRSCESYDLTGHKVFSDLSKEVEVLRGL